MTAIRTTVLFERELWLRVGSAPCGQHPNLDGYIAAKFGITGTVNLAHPTRTMPVR